MEKELKKLMSDIFGINISFISDDMTFENTEKWDSLKHMKLVVSMEEEFDIEFTADDIVSMLSYINIKKKLNEKGLNI